MGARNFEKIVDSEERLRAVLGQPSERALGKERPRLDAHCRTFIAHAPFLILGTSDAGGRCDVSPKGDQPGFVKVLDETHLAIPDRVGNNRLDGMRNILHNPHVGLIFLIPGREETLRVNGRAWIVRDEEILAKLSARDKLPQLAIGVETEEVFFHCPKAFRRSKLWEPASWPDRDALPTMACVLYEKLQPAGKTLEEYLRESEEGLQRTLY